MTYRTNPDLLLLINQQENSLIKNFCFAVFLFLASPFLLCYTSHSFDISFWVSELIIFLALGFIQYRQIGSKTTLISKTAIEVSSIENELFVSTAPVKVLFLINRPSIVLKFNIQGTTITKVDYPLKAVYDLDNSVYKLNNTENEMYVISDFFEPGFENYLSQLWIHS